MTNKELTPEEIAYKYVHGNHDALTDTQEKKDMANDIWKFAKDYAAEAVEKYKNDLYSKLTDFGCWAADLGKGQCKEQCEKCQVEYETQLTQEEEFLSKKKLYDPNAYITINQNTVAKLLKEYAAKAVEEDQKQCICREL